jgi:hypothetical protein
MGQRMHQYGIDTVQRLRDTQRASVVAIGHAIAACAAQAQHASRL